MGRNVVAPTKALATSSSLSHHRIHTCHTRCPMLIDTSTVLIVACRVVSALTPALTVHNHVHTLLLAACRPPLQRTPHHSFRRQFTTLSRHTDRLRRRPSSFTNSPPSQTMAQHHTTLHFHSPHHRTTSL